MALETIDILLIKFGFLGAVLSTVTILTIIYFLRAKKLKEKVKLNDELYRNMFLKKNVYTTKYKRKG